MKDVERLMGISYPTIKSRLAKLNAALGGEPPAGPESRAAAEPPTGPDAEERAAILDRLAAGEIAPAEAARLLRGESDRTGASPNR